MRYAVKCPFSCNVGPSTIKPLPKICDAFVFVLFLSNFSLAIKFISLVLFLINFSSMQRYKLLIGLIFLYRILRHMLDLMLYTNGKGFLWVWMLIYLVQSFNYICSSITCFLELILHIEKGTFTPDWFTRLQPNPLLYMVSTALTRKVLLGFKVWYQI